VVYAGLGGLCGGGGGLGVGAAVGGGEESGAKSGRANTPECGCVERGGGGGAGGVGGAALEPGPPRAKRPRGRE